MKTNVNRWVRLVASVIAMMMIANLQYSWTLFVKPIMGATGWKLSQVQLGFTLFIAFETWAMPLSGWLMDKFGAKKLFIFSLVIFTIGSVFCGMAWNLDTEIIFRIFQALGGGWWNRPYAEGSRDASEQRNR